MSYMSIEVEFGVIFNFFIWQKRREGIVLDFSVWIV